MINIIDKAYIPDIREIAEYVDHPLFNEMRAHLDTVYGARHEIAYSGDQVLPGWNVRFYKSGKTLCRLYPKRNGFSVLLVIGPAEKARAEAILPNLSEDTQRLYRDTKEGMGQRWLLFNAVEPGDVYNDLLTLIALRRNIGKTKP